MLTLLFYTEKLDCNFDDGLCSTWSNAEGDDFDWELKRLRTSTRGTGPDRDHTSGGGYYMYIEASLPRQDGDMAILRSKEVEWHTDNKMCLQFW